MSKCHKDGKSWFRVTLTKPRLCEVSPITTEKRSPVKPKKSPEQVKPEPMKSKPPITQSKKPRKIEEPVNPVAPSDEASAMFNIVKAVLGDTPCHADVLDFISAKSGQPMNIAAAIHIQQTLRPKRIRFDSKGTPLYEMPEPWALETVEALLEGRTPPEPPPLPEKPRWKRKVKNP